MFVLMNKEYKYGTTLGYNFALLFVWLYADLDTVNGNFHII